MRVIGGTFRGRRLLTPKGLGTRPATDRVRESIFNLISARMSLDGISVLDLFCGTGALGLEAISRGASRATFVESEPRVLAVARENAARLGVNDRCVFVRRDVAAFVRRPREQFDLVFADPPYGLDIVSGLPEQVIPMLHSHGFFLLEHDRRLKFHEVRGWVDSRVYGRTIVSIFMAIPTDQTQSGNHEEPT